MRAGKKSGWLANSVATLLLFGLGTHLFLEYDAVPGHDLAVGFLLRRLGNPDLPAATHRSPALARETVLYVLGGSSASLLSKFKVAAQHYREGECATIVILHEPGINEYQPLLRRNLTNDEWALEKLVNLGVRQEDVELLTVKPAFWGTLTEARSLAEFVRRKGSRRLILVTALPHTRRVRQSFSCLLRGVDVEVRVLASDQAFSLRNLMVEYLKLTLYNALLLPRNCGSGG